jgi:exopolysaccharide biosynthesis polyprenyl glycosylphosphotransferase
VGMTRRYILLIMFKFFDLALLVGSLIAASITSLHAVSAISLTKFLAMRISVRNFVLFTILLLLWHVLFFFFDLYESKRLGGRDTEAIDVLKATTLATVVLFLVGSLFIPSIASPLSLVLFWSLSTDSVLLSRRLLRYLLGHIRRRGRNSRQILIVGTNPRAVMLARELEAQSVLGYRILGFVDDKWPGMEEFGKSGYAFACNFQGFPSFVRGNVVDEVVITLPIKSFYREASRIAAVCEEHGVITHFLSNLFDLKNARTKEDSVDYDSLVTLNAGPPQRLSLAVKRVLDVVISVLSIICLAPLFLITAALVALTSPGPIFFVQKRVGLNKRPISVYKFRTMVADAEAKFSEVEHLNEVSGPVFKIKNDPRVTRLGKYLRKCSIDELPQLFNVLKGDMSLVGPRAMAVRDFAGFDQDWHRRRFSVRPGITCLWQVNGRSSVPFEKWMELDMEYIDKWSLWLDLQILVKTIPAVLKGSGAV